MSNESIEIDFASKKRVAFVCSGGAVKAATFHTGVALALEEAGFSFVGQGMDMLPVETDPSRRIQVYVGSSAGSLLSTFLAQGGSMGHMLSLFDKNPKDESIPGLKYWEMLSPRFSGAAKLLSFDSFFIKLLRGQNFQSPFSTEGLSRYIQNHVNKTENFSELDADLFVVATELNTSKKVIFGKYKSISSDERIEYRNDVAISDACACSMALPPIYHPYRLQVQGEAKDFYDGEIYEPLSSHVARDMDSDLIICSYTHQPVHLNAKKGSIADMGVQEILVQALYQTIEQKIQQARQARRREKKLIDDVSTFFIEHGLSKELRDKLVGKMERRMTYKDKVDYIYISPKATDLEMFRMPHFSLNKKHTAHLVKRGFVAATTVLRQYRIGE